MTDPYSNTPGGYPAPGAFSDYTGSAVPQAPTTPRLGWVALAVGAIALVGSIVNALIIYATLDRALIGGSENGAVAALAITLVNGLLIWFAFGLWAIIQSLVAITTKRGQVQGVIALVLGLIGPWAGVMLAAILFSQAVGTT